MKCELLIFLAAISVSVSAKLDVRSNALADVATEDATVNREELGEKTDLSSLRVEFKDPCIPDPCENNGTCVEYEENAFWCICHVGFAGEKCEKKIYEVTTQTSTEKTPTTTKNYEVTTEPSTKKTPTEPINCDCGDMSNGCTFNEDGSKVCTCKLGYYPNNGKCTEVCVANYECHNGGLCVGDWPKFCDCPSPYTGDMCEHNPLCDKLQETCNAIGGICKMEWGKAFCDCDERKVYKPDSEKCGDICTDTTCVNGACKVIGRDFECHCDSGFKGRHCEIRDYSNHITSYFQQTIAITVVCATALVILAIVLIVVGCMCHRKRKQKKKENQDKSIT